MTAWLPIIIPAAIAALGTVTDALAPYIASHPKIALFIGALGSIATALTRSPIKK